MHLRSLRGCSALFCHSVHCWCSPAWEPLPGAGAGICCCSLVDVKQKSNEKNVFMWWGMIDYKEANIVSVARCWWRTGTTEKFLMRYCAAERFLQPKRCDVETVNSNEMKMCFELIIVSRLDSVFFSLCSTSTAVCCCCLPYDTKRRRTQHIIEQLLFLN